MDREPLCAESAPLSVRAQAALSAVTICMTIVLTLIEHDIVIRFRKLFTPLQINTVTASRRPGLPPSVPSVHHLTLSLPTRVRDTVATVHHTVKGGQPCELGRARPRTSGQMRGSRPSPVRQGDAWLSPTCSPPRRRRASNVPAGTSPGEDALGQAPSMEPHRGRHRSKTILSFPPQWSPFSLPGK